MYCKCVLYCCHRVSIQLQLNIPYQRAQNKGPIPQNQLMINNMYFRTIWTNKMHYFILIYFNNNPLHVSSMLAVHQQETQLCINSSWYSYALCWLDGTPSRSCQQPINITHDYTNCCLYTVDPPDDEQQTCSKHVEVNYTNKLIENSVSCKILIYYSCILQSPVAG
jgi:hypothetical protein